MFKFKNPDNSETKANNSKKKNPKFKNVVEKSAPWTEWIYRIFTLLAFLSIIMILIYLGAAGSGMVAGYFAGAIGVSTQESVIDALKHIDLYTIMFSSAMIIFFDVLIIWTIIQLIKGTFRWLFIGKIKASFDAYKK